MADDQVPKAMNIPLGVILRRKPGVTRWAKWAWEAVAVVPNAGPGGFRVLREDGDTTDPRGKRRVSIAVDDATYRKRTALLN